MKYLAFLLAVFTIPAFACPNQLNFPDENGNDRIVTIPCGYILADANTVARFVPFNEPDDEFGDFDGRTIIIGQIETIAKVKRNGRLNTVWRDPKGWNVNYVITCLAINQGLLYSRRCEGFLSVVDGDAFDINGLVGVDLGVWLGAERSVIESANILRFTGVTDAVPNADIVADPGDVWVKLHGSYDQDETTGTGVFADVMVGTESWATFNWYFRGQVDPHGSGDIYGRSKVSAFGRKRKH